MGAEGEETIGKLHNIFEGIADAILRRGANDEEVGVINSWREKIKKATGNTIRTILKSAIEVLEKVLGRKNDYH